MTEQSKLDQNLQALEHKMEWLKHHITTRVEKYFQDDENGYDILETLPLAEMGGSSYDDFVLEQNLDKSEQLLLLIVIGQYFYPEVFDVFFIEDKSLNKKFTIFGGEILGATFIPTLQTLAFILSGSNKAERYKMLNYFSNDATFTRLNVIKVKTKEGAPAFFNSSVALSQEHQLFLLEGKAYEPHYSESFPATKMTTKLDWEDAVFDQVTWHALQEIRNWIAYKEEILQNSHFNKVMGKGYRALFYGPPGTGKTMTASLIGKEFHMPVFRVDLASVVSKYIGETEKNLEHIFRTGEHKNWIIFFDEADSLFNQRFDASSSNDVFANQQVAYLLQRIENYNGVVVLATNLIDNLDPAFIRRFQSTIYFPKPDVDQRIVLWENYFKGGFEAMQVDFKNISRNYTITGASIINVLQFCAIRVTERQDKVLYEEDVVLGINKELTKEGQSLVI